MSLSERERERGNVRGGGGGEKSKKRNEAKELRCKKSTKIKITFDCIHSYLLNACPQLNGSITHLFATVDR